LAHLKTFYIIAKEGSLTRAAHLLHTSQSSLSRTLQTLEYYAKAQLFERHARGLKLTSQGEKVFHYAQKVVQEHEVFKHSLLNDFNETEGELKILTTPGMVSIWLPEIIPGFLKKYPGIKLDINSSLTNLERDLEKADILIRTRIDLHPNLVQRRVLAGNYKLWASPDYLKEFGIPEKPEDLDHHRLLVFERAQFNSLANTYWILEVGSDIHKTREPYLVVNSQEGLIACAKKGLGIIQMPSVLIKFRNENNQLLNILKETTGPIIDVYGIYPSKTKNLKRINLFMDYLEDKLLKDDLYN
ncbi:MAG: LysR family transcriptional regulator, partial [Candidatus Paracaedimonas acanthamoebae]|nr:LysR family transcriptional regulator [Candidatus Paracaedimonas acanthamoebae]